VFIDDGGYRRRDLWEQEFVRDGRTIPWEEAMALFRDRTDRPGPSTWQAGTYPDGEGDYPVAGVSWYEAAAYARFVGQELPTVYHWRRALASGALAWVLPASVLEADEPSPVGQGVGWTGTYDMLGNVREWCLNSKGEERFILGGGWNDAYHFGYSTLAQSPFDRSAANGFRLAITRDASMAMQRAQQPVRESDDRPLPEPVTDDVFAAYRSDYEYDPAPLNATIEATESERYWTRERITFDAAYADERVILDLYLPRSGSSRFQTIVFWPPGAARIVPSAEQLKSHLDFALRNGRAVAYPIYKGMLERRLAVPPSLATIAGRDLTIQQVKDLRRTIDYLETRGDIDAGALAYFGVSFGAWAGALALAVEPRLRLAILNQVGMRRGLNAEIDVANFLPRVNVPVLQLNGQTDTIYPIETSAKPFFELLGTPAEDKRHVITPSGHFAPPPAVIGETLNWLDKYFGPPGS
jgi:hypothetical protein